MVRAKVKMPVWVRCKVIGNDGEKREEIDNKF